MNNNKKVIFVILALLVGSCGGFLFFKHKETQKQNALLEQEIKRKVILDSMKIKHYQDSVKRLEYIADSIIAEKNRLAEVVDSTQEILEGDNYIYEELHSFDNHITLKSRLFNLENLENWQRVSPNSRTIINIDYEDDIETLLFLSVTGADKIRGVKKIINQATIRLAEKIMTKDRRIRAIAELFNQSEFLKDVEILDTKTNIDRTINIYFTDKSAAYKWKDGKINGFTPFQVFEKRSQCKQHFKRKQLLRGGFTICIENTSEVSDVDFAIQVIGIKSKNPSKKIEDFLENPETSNNEQNVKEQPIPLFKCQAYTDWVGNYYGVQLCAVSDCEVAAKKRDRFKELTNELAYVIKSKSKPKTPYLVIYGRYNSEDEAREYATQINKKLPEFKGAFITHYSEHLEK